jgi:hypothetical protein
MMQKKAKRKKRKTIIAILLLLAIILSASTFAYWASFVEGTNQDATGTLTVGSADSVDTEFILTNELNSGGYLVPFGLKLSSNEEYAVEEVNVSYDIKWQETAEMKQLEGSTSTGLIRTSHQVIIEQNGEILSYDGHETIYDLINVEHVESNPIELVLEADAETFNFLITLDEPANQEEYNLISKSKITVVFTYVIIDNNIETIDNSEDAILSLEIQE